MTLELAVSVGWLVGRLVGQSVCHIFDFPLLPTHPHLRGVYTALFILEIRNKAVHHLGERTVFLVHFQFSLLFSLQ